MSNDYLKKRLENLQREENTKSGNFKKKKINLKEKLKMKNIC